MALESRRTRPYAPLIGGILIGVAHAAWGGAIEHENYSPPLEGCRGGLSPTGRPTPKADAFCPSLEGIFMGGIMRLRAAIVVCLAFVPVISASAQDFSGRYHCGGQWT